MDKIIRNAKKALSGHDTIYGLAGFVFGPVTRHRERQKKARQIKIFRENALDALKAFVDCMEEQGIKYTLAFGSILGAIREHGFIKHDIDIDTAIWIDDYKPDMVAALEKVGFTWVFSHTVDDGKLGREDTFEYHGVRIDVFYFYPAIDKLPYCCDFLWQDELGPSCRLPRRVEIPLSHERRKVPFEGIEVYVPDNAEEFCKFRYGSDYMTPNPSWNWINEREHIVEWHDKVGVTKSQKYPHGKPEET